MSCSSTSCNNKCASTRSKRSSTKIYTGLFTVQRIPQRDPISPNPASGLRVRFPKLQMPNGLLNAYLDPPDSPGDCIFAQTTECVSADLDTRITPCQFGGAPDCENCGCMASAGLAAVGRHRLGGVIPIDALFKGSIGVGRAVRTVSDTLPKTAHRGEFRAKRPGPQDAY